MTQDAFALFAKGYDQVRFFPRQSDSKDGFGFVYILQKAFLKCIVEVAKQETVFLGKSPQSMSPPNNPLQ